MMATVNYYGEEPLNVSLRKKCAARLVDTEPVQKGKRRRTLKPAILDNGVRIMIRSSSVRMKISSAYRIDGIF